MPWLHSAIILAWAQRGGFDCPTANAARDPDPAFRCRAVRAARLAAAATGMIDRAFLPRCDYPFFESVST
ncbi:MAG: hypothetical protein B7Y43_08320 [Sphingomonas sp. 28-62-20]|nr:MAG: hypothetical protein B7Y43_08320 [Sphingomonas sp. 28-62-20]